MNDLPAPVKRYLEKYPVSGWQLQANSDRKFCNIIVIPAISEFENIKTLLGSLIQNDDPLLNTSLIIFVINNLASSNAEVKKNNLITIDY